MYYDTLQNYVKWAGTVFWPKFLHFSAIFLQIPFFLNNQSVDLLPFRWRGCVTGTPIEKTTATVMSKTATSSLCPNSTNEYSTAITVAGPHTKLPILS
jgi:hypothetical protein